MPESAATVLLADDDLFFSARILSVLQKLGYRTQTAADLEQALARVAEERPALVVVNLASARLGGIDLIRRLKAEPNPPRVLAFLSHVKIPAVREEALAAGADKLVANSAISMRLPDIVREVLDGKIAHQVEEEDEETAEQDGRPSPVVGGSSS